MDGTWFGNPTGATDFSSLLNVHCGSVFHPAFYSVSTTVFPPGVNPPECFDTPPFKLRLSAVLFLVFVAWTGIYKATPLQALTGPEGSRRLRLPDFKSSVQGPPAACGPQGVSPRDIKGQEQQETQRVLSSQPPLVVCVSVQTEDRDDRQTADTTACSNVHTCKVTICGRRSHSI
jgi:hypothetical protein